MSTTRLMQASLVLALTLGAARPATVQDYKSWNCAQVQGNLTEVVVDSKVAPWDTIGRVVSTADGDLTSVGSAILTAVFPGKAAGTLEAKAGRWMVLSPSDQIWASDAVVLTPIPNSPDVNDVVTITLRGGQGKYLNATGTIVATGKGFNFFPAPVAGKSYFTFRYSGQVCVP
jgi:hypothetical protein